MYTGTWLLKKLCIVKICVRGTIHRSKVTQKTLKEARWKDKGARTYKGKSGFTNEFGTWRAHLLILTILLAWCYNSYFRGISTTMKWGLRHLQGYSYKLDASFEGQLKTLRNINLFPFRRSNVHRTAVFVTYSQVLRIPDRHLPCDQHRPPPPTLVTC